MAARFLVAFLIVALFSTISAGDQTSPAIARQVSLGERIACQTAIEEVYWRHRTAAAEDASKLSFAEAVPQEVIRRSAEDAVLKSLALQRFWGVTITGDQLQAELDRMAEHSKSPDVLRSEHSEVSPGLGTALDQTTANGLPGLFRKKPCSFSHGTAALSSRIT